MSTFHIKSWNLEDLEQGRGRLKTKVGNDMIDLEVGMVENNNERIKRIHVDHHWN